VVAGTATAVSGRVARRQQAKYQQKADAQAYQDEQQAPQEEAPPQYQQAPPQYQQAPPPAPAGEPNLADEIQRLANLKSQGILSEDEFTAAKNKLLGL
jgi:hypothetical protein